MGCDIHVIVAKYEDGKRTILWEPEAYYRDGREHTQAEHDEHWKNSRLAGRRNYERFARLSGVRGDGPEANDWPEWMQDHEDYTCEDFHSHTHLPIREAARIFLETEYDFDSNDRAALARVNPIAMYFHVDETQHNLDNVWVLVSYDN